MKIAFVTDLHLVEDAATGSVRGYQLEGLARVVEGIKDAGADLILLGGDNSGHDIPHKATPAELNAHVDFRVALAEIAPVLEVQGNHDFVGNYEVFNRLASKHPIAFASSPGGVDVKELGGPDCMVWLLPWIFPSAVEVEADVDAAVAYRDYVYSEVEALAATAAETIEQEHRERIVRPHFLLGHVAVRDALLRDGQPAVPVSDPVIDSAALMPDGLYEAGFFGHYHHMQVVRFDGDRPIGVYGGSLFVNEYGETPDKGWTLYNTSGGAFTRHEIEQPLMVRVTLDPATGRVQTKPHVDVHDVEGLGRFDFDSVMVKLVVDLPATGLGHHAVVRDRAVSLIKATAMSLRVVYKGGAEPPKERDGAAEVSEAASVEDKLGVYLRKVRAPSVPEETARLVVGLYRELSTEGEGT